MIDTIFNTVNAISNKEQRGSLSPAKFNYLVNNAVNTIYNEYDIGKFINRSNRGFTTKGLGDEVKMERERYQHYYKYNTMTLVGGIYTLPSDCNYLDSITYAGKELDECASAKEFNLLKTSEDFQASLDFPIYLRLGNVLSVFPTSIASELELYYVRKPLVAKWTYNEVSGVALFNSGKDDYQDADIHASEEPNIILNVLSQIGINLKETELAQYAEMLKDKKEKYENII